MEVQTLKKLHATRIIVSPNDGATKRPIIYWLAVETVQEG